MTATSHVSSSSSSLLPQAPYSQQEPHMNRAFSWKQQRYVVHETPERLNICETYIEREIARKPWIYDVIGGVREAERVLLNCDDFMIVPDIDSHENPHLQPNNNSHENGLNHIKGTTVQGRENASGCEHGPSNIVHWLVIFKDRNLRSLRDLRGAEQPSSSCSSPSSNDGESEGTTSHVNYLPLLYRVRDTMRALVHPFEDETMLYFHYPPSVWQLHLHVSFPCDTLRTTNDMQKVQFLDDVISNLETYSDYYRSSTLTYVLPAGHELLRLYGLPKGQHPRHYTSTSSTAYTLCTLQTYPHSNSHRPSTRRTGSLPPCTASHPVSTTSTRSRSTSTHQQPRITQEI